MTKPIGWFKDKSALDKYLQYIGNLRGVQQRVFKQMCRTKFEKMMFNFADDATEFYLSKKDIDELYLDYKINTK